MKEMVLHESLPSHKVPNQFTREERTQLDTIIDLLIPADADFPAPSTLHLINELLPDELPIHAYKSKLNGIDAQQLHGILRDLNISSGGSFCQASTDVKHRVLRQFERKEPALFQAFWTLVNYSYYAKLAMISTVSQSGHLLQSDLIN